MSDFFRRYLLPGFVFESAVIAGGYATGRELVEFFLPAGPWGGVLGMIVSMLVWSAVLMVSFELARSRTRLRLSLVLQAAARSRLVPVRDRVFPAGRPDHGRHGRGGGRDHHTICSACRRLVGSLGMIAATGLMLFYSSAAIEKFLGLSVGYLYLVYIVFVVWSFVAFGDRIEATFAAVPRRRQAGSRPALPMPVTTSRRSRRFSSASAT